jgi:hypothetical protein
MDDSKIEEDARELCRMFISLYPNSSRDESVLSRAWIEQWQQPAETFGPALDRAVAKGWIEPVPPSSRSYQVTADGTWASQGQGLFD